MISFGEYALTEDQQKQVRRYIRNLLEVEPGPYESCPFYGRCENPICPIDPIREKRIWYSDEGLCLNPEYKGDKAVVSQKKIAKKHAQGYFTHAMLNRDIIVKKGIQGIAPDIPESVYDRGQEAIDSLYAEREQAWIGAHPELTQEQREKMKSRGMKGWKLSNDMVGCFQTIPISVMSGTRRDSEASFQKAKGSEGKIIRVRKICSLHII